LTNFNKEQSPHDNCRSLFLNDLLFLVGFCVLVTLSNGHPTPYELPANMTCKDNPPLRSFHIHLLFWQNNKENTAGALALKQQFAVDFNLTLEPPCRDLFQEDRLCIFDPDMGPAGPFLTAQWAIFALPGQYNAPLQWFMQNRGDYDVLFHPNSGCEVEDHTLWPYWAGRVWEIDATIFSCDSPGCGLGNQTQKRISHN